MEGEMAKRGWNGEGRTNGFGRGFGDDPRWDGLPGDELPWGDWDEEIDLGGDHGTEDELTGHDLSGMDALDALFLDEFLDDASELGSPSESWNWISPINVDAEGRIFRKTRFPVFLGGPAEAEWMWVEVQSLEDRSGVLANQPLFVPDLTVGDVVRFEVIPEGRPLAGCAEAVEW